jgi:hypothetical protein
MFRKPGFTTVLLLLTLFSGKLLYAASMPMNLVMPATQGMSQQMDHCHDMDSDCAMADHGEHDSYAQCLLDCQDSCSISALLTMDIPGLSYHKTATHFTFLAPTFSRRLEPLYRPPQA